MQNESMPFQEWIGVGDASGLQCSIIEIRWPDMSNGD